MKNLQFGPYIYINGGTLPNVWGKSPQILAPAAMTTHNFVANRKGEYRCDKCFLKSQDFTQSMYIIIHHNMAILASSCTGKDIFSCCSNPSGSARWNNREQCFKCVDCDTTVSTDHSYLGSRVNIIIGTPLGIPKPGCEHEYVNYQGLNESFEYCKKCDVKRDDVGT